MKRTVLVAAVIALASTPALADNQALDSLIDSALRGGHAIESLLYNQPVLAVPVANRPCPTVGVIYQDGGRRRGGQRIDNFQACPGSEPELINDVSPALPDDPQFQQLTQMAIRGALRYGAQRRDWGEYLIDTRRLSAADGYGCGQVETVISSMGMLVTYQVGRLCP